MRKVRYILSAACLAFSALAWTVPALAVSVDKWYQVVDVTQVVADFHAALQMAPAVPDAPLASTPLQVLSVIYGTTERPRGVGAEPVSLGLTAGGGIRGPPPERQT